MKTKKSWDEVVGFGWALRADRKRNLPAGWLEFAVAVGPQGSAVQGAHVTLGGREAVVGFSEEYDDGKVVIDYDKNQCVVGVEFLAHVEPIDVPAFVQRAKQRDSVLLFVAAATAMHWWEFLEFGLRIQEDEVRPRTEASRKLQQKIRPRWEKSAHASRLVA